MDFIDIVAKAGRNKKYGEWAILALDPGHTTGWAFLEECELKAAGQIDTSSMELCLKNATALLQQYRPPIIVMEDYRVYKWRAKHHVGSEMLTTRVIGGIEVLAFQMFVANNEDGQIIKQPASVAKGFVTDAKLKDWGFWREGERHARDAIRHGCYYILFGQIQQSGAGKGTTVG